jgi:hypothetical protein
MSMGCLRYMNELSGRGRVSAQLMRTSTLATLPLKKHNFHHGRRYEPDQGNTEKGHRNKL